MVYLSLFMNTKAIKTSISLLIVLLVVSVRHTEATGQTVIRGNTVCDADYPGGPFDFPPAPITFGTLLNALTASTHVHFIIQPTVATLPVTVPAVSMPWAIVLRALLHVNGLAAICRSQDIVEIVSTNSMPVEVLTRTPRALAGTLSGFGALTVADGGASGQFGAGVGVAFTKRVSAEFEFAAQPVLRDKHVDSLGFPATINGTAVNAEPHLSVVSYMGVGRIDFPLAGHSFVPYLTIGGGAARVSMRLDLVQAGPSPVAPANIQFGLTQQLPSSEVAVMLRPTGGIAWPMSSRLSIGVEIGYSRLFGTSQDFGYGTALGKARLLF
jgi:hypothetical protein